MSDLFLMKDCESCKHVIDSVLCKTCSDNDNWAANEDAPWNVCQNCDHADGMCLECVFFGRIREEVADVDLPQDDDVTITEVFEALAESPPSSQHQDIPGKSCSYNKDTSGKTPFELLEWDLLEEVAVARQYGVMKYGNPMGWLQVPKAKAVYFAAMLRHWRKMNAGVIYDAEALDQFNMKVTHRGMLLCNAMFLAAFYRDEPDVPMEEDRK
jgi:hypothetical protein